MHEPLRADDQADAFEELSRRARQLPRDDVVGRRNEHVAAVRLEVLVFLILKDARDLEIPTQYKTRWKGDPQCPCARSPASLAAPLRIHCRLRAGVGNAELLPHKALESLPELQTAGAPST